MRKVALNIGCGRSTIQSTPEMQWINVDSYERENKLDMVLDITRAFPFDKETIDFIYAEQFIEHLEWNDGFKFLQDCFKILKEGGILRLVLPHYKKIFQMYLEKNTDFFKVFFDELNNGDLPYYSWVYSNPEEVREKRKDNLPPAWHTSYKLEDRKRLSLRLKHYKYPIEIVNWFTHQYHEHVCLYDFKSLSGILTQIGFKEVIETEIKDMDSHAPSRITSSIYIEGVK